jgi:hypothetical protein
MLLQFCYGMQIAKNAALILAQDVVKCATTVSYSSQSRVQQYCSMGRFFMLGEKLLVA